MYLLHYMLLTVAQLVEALRYKPEGWGIFPGGVTENFH
jgi:hypothetical protein